MSARFELLAGDSMTGKTYSLARQVLEEAHAYPDKKFYIIVPEQAGNAYEKKLIQMNQALFGTPGFMNIDILGFNRLSYRIFEEFGITETSVLEEYEKNMLVRVASGKVRSELEIYGGSIDRTGFTKEIKSLISEMIQYNVSPEELESAARDIEKDREGLSAKLRDVSKIYQVFMDILDSRRSALSLGDEVDLSMTISEERFKLLARILKTDRPSSLVDGAVFVFDEYRGYTPDQLSVIGALKKRAEVLRFSLCIDANTLKRFLDGRGEVKDTDIFYQSYMTYRRLSETLGERPEIEYLRKHFNKSSDLIHLSENIFRYPVKEYKDETKSIEIYHTDNFEKELRVVAQMIRDEVKAGARYKTLPVLEFRAAHSAAQDAVFTDVDPAFIEKMGLFTIQSQCRDKDEYLTRPDLGRKLSEEGAKIVDEKCVKHPKVQVYIADGLSSAAIEANANEVYPAIVQGLKNHGVDVGTPFFLKYGRVASMDQISEITGADVTCVLIGERPGLITAQSMSAYMAYKATVGMPEARRTVISNIHKEGTNPAEAGAHIADILLKMLETKSSGTDLKL